MKAATAAQPRSELQIGRVLRSLGATGARGEGATDSVIVARRYDGSDTTRRCCSQCAAPDRSIVVVRAGVVPAGRVVCGQAAQLNQLRAQRMALSGCSAGTGRAKAESKLSAKHQRRLLLSWGVMRWSARAGRS